MGKAPTAMEPKKKTLRERLSTLPPGAVLERGPHDGPEGHRAPSLNDATEAQLSQPDFMDESIARKIIQVREQHGGFSAWEELHEFAGLSVTTIADLQRSFRLVARQDGSRGNLG